MPLLKVNWPATASVTRPRTLVSDGSDSVAKTVKPMKSAMREILGLEVHYVDICVGYEPVFEAGDGGRQVAVGVGVGVRRYQKCSSLRTLRQGPRP